MPIFNNPKILLNKTAVLFENPQESKTRFMFIKKLSCFVRRYRNIWNPLDIVKTKSHR